MKSSSEGTLFSKPQTSPTRCIRCQYNDKRFFIYNAMTSLWLIQYDSYFSYLYLSLCSFLPCGSRLFRIPSRVFDTASLAPIMGFRTAIGTALTTALSGPFLSAFILFLSDKARTHIVSRPLIHFHRYSQNSLSCRIDVPR